MAMMPITAMTAAATIAALSLIDRSGRWIVAALKPDQAPGGGVANTNGGGSEEEPDGDHFLLPHFCLAFLPRRPVSQPRAKLTRVATAEMA